MGIVGRHHLPTCRHLCCRMMPLFPDEHGGPPSSAGSGSTFHHAISRTWPAAALATVIGGPAVDFTGVVRPWARTTVKLSDERQQWVVSGYWHRAAPTERRDEHLNP